MRRMLTLFLAVLLLCTAFPALAEDVCTVEDASQTDRITTSCSYIKVRCPVDEGVSVTVTVRDEWGSLVYQRSYGECSGTFRSGEIHLPLIGSGTAYTLTVEAGNDLHTVKVYRERPLLTDSSVYVGEMTLKDMFDGNRRKSAVVLDMAELEGKTLTMPMIAGGMLVGHVTFRVKDGLVTADAELLAEGSIDKVKVFVARDALTAATLGSNRFTGEKVSAGKPFDAGSTPYVAVMVQLTVSYDEATARAWHADKDAWEEQMTWWLRMQEQTANDANG